MKAINHIILLLTCILVLLLVGCNDRQAPTEASIQAPATSVEATIINETNPKTEDRTSWQKPQLIISKLGNLQDKVVADIGAGTGYFAFQLMRKAKQVIAVEIDENMIALMKAFAGTLSDEMRDKIKIRLGQPDNPMLKPNEVDVALFVNVIPYIQNRVQYLSQLRSNLNTEGKVVIVDFKVRRLSIDAPPYDERVLPHIIEEELYAAGFTEITIDDSTLDYQYIITAN